MEHRVLICLLGDITVRVDDGEPVRLTAKSRMGASLMEYLILQRGAPVQGGRLIRELWTERSGKNPENALKTMVSRLRAMLHDICVGLGDCVACGAGGYYWQPQPGVRVDALDILEGREKLRPDTPDKEKRAILERIAAAYTADLYNSGDIASGGALVNYLHKEYLDAVYALVDLLREEKNWQEIDRVCRRAQTIDDRDERLHMESMNAMLRLDRMGEATEEYRRLMHRRRAEDRGDQEGEVRSSVLVLHEAGRQLRLNLDTICRELRDQDRERRGPFFCDYDAFKEIYNIQMRNLERLGSTMFLGVILVSGEESEFSSVSRESGMAGLMEILRNNLRKGDIVTRVSPDTLAMLLPTVNYQTGSMVMERIEKQFYREYPTGGVAMHYRIAPLGTVIAQAE